MQYFLVGPENKLTPIPDFRLFRAQQTYRQVNTFDATYVIPERKMPDHFSCTNPGGRLPSPFLIVDEQARVFDCAANSVNLGSGGVLITGIVLQEYDAPDKARALAEIAATIQSRSPEA